jgi:hypothetical protein
MPKKNKKAEKFENKIKKIKTPKTLKKMGFKKVHQEKGFVMFELSPSKGGK